MKISKEEKVRNVREKYYQLRESLTEKSRRLWAAVQARELGWGGMSIIHEATGLDFKTIHKGLMELDGGIKKTGIRRSGGGRKKLTKTEEGLESALNELLEPLTRGDLRVGVALDEQKHIQVM